MSRETVRPSADVLERLHQYARGGGHGERLREAIGAWHRGYSRKPSPFPIGCNREDANDATETLVLLAAAHDAFLRESAPLGPQFDLIAAPEQGRFGVLVERVCRMEDAILPCIARCLDSVHGESGGIVKPVSSVPPVKSWTAGEILEKGDSEAPAWNQHEGFGFNADFTTVRWFGTEYRFKKGQQALLIGHLLSAYQQGRVGLSADVLGRKIESETMPFRVEKVLGKHLAWRSMVQKLDTGEFRLSEPPGAA